MSFIAMAEAEPRITTICIVSSTVPTLYEQGVRAEPVDGTLLPLAERLGVEAPDTESVLIYRQQSHLLPHEPGDTSKVLVLYDENYPILQGTMQEVGDGLLVVKPESLDEGPLLEGFARAIRGYKRRREMEQEIARVREQRARQQRLSWVAFGAAAVVYVGRELANNFVEHYPGDHVANPLMIGAAAVSAAIGAWLFMGIRPKAKLKPLPEEPLPDLTGLASPVRFYIQMRE